MGLSKQEYWSGLPCPPPGDLPNPGIKPASLMSPTFVGRFFITCEVPSPLHHYIITQNMFFSLIRMEKRLVSLIKKEKKSLVFLIKRVEVQFSSVSQLCLSSMPGLPVHHQLPEFTQIHVHGVGDASSHLFCHPLHLLHPIPPSIRVFSNESALCIRWPRIGVSASASVLPMNTQD